MHKPTEWLSIYLWLVITPMIWSTEHWKLNHMLALDTIIYLTVETARQMLDTQVDMRVQQAWTFLIVGSAAAGGLGCSAD